MLMRKKVKWAQIVHEMIQENNPDIVLSEQGPDDLCIPKV